MMTAEQKAFTMTPANSRDSLFKMVLPEVSMSTRARVAILPAKAVNPTPGKRDNPIRIPRMAPTAEPPETPRI